MPRRAHILMAIFVLGALSPPTVAAVELPGGFTNETVVSGLRQPTSMAFLPDGRILFTEQRTARVRLVVGNHIAASDPVLVVPDVQAFFTEQGLQGIAVDPAWPTRPYVYLFHNRPHAPSPPSGMCRLVRYTASGDLDDPSGETLTLADPLLLIDDIPDHTQWHQAGCLRFGPDDHLYVGLGDDDVDPCVAADSTSLRGQILRLDVSSLPPGGGAQVARELITPDDNPLVTTDANAKMVWAYGLRNPWRFSIDPVTGKLYIVDVGEADFEEISEADPGDFLGWPWREGFLVMPRPSCPEPGGEGTIAYREPLVAQGHGEGLIAFFGGGIYRPITGAPANWPGEYDGDVFYGEYYSGIYRRLKLDGGAWGPALPVPGQPNATDWGTGFKSAVDFHVGPDGSVWWLRQFDDDFSSNSGSIERIHFGASVDSPPPPPVARLSLMAWPSPFTNRAEFSFGVVGGGAAKLVVYDVSGRTLRVLWDGAAPDPQVRVSWDGRDEEGNVVPPGVYLARLAHAGVVRTVRVLRIEAR